MTEPALFDWPPDASPYVKPATDTLRDENASEREKFLAGAVLRMATLVDHAAGRADAMEKRGDSFEERFREARAELRRPRETPDA